MYVSMLSDCEIVSKIALTKTKTGADMCQFRVRCSGSGFYTLNAYDEEAVKIVNMVKKSKEKILFLNLTIKENQIDITDPATGQKKWKQCRTVLSSDYVHKSPTEYGFDQTEERGE